MCIRDSTQTVINWVIDSTILSERHTRWWTNILIQSEHVECRMTCLYMARSNSRTTTSRGILYRCQFGRSVINVSSEDIRNVRVSVTVGEMWTTNYETSETDISNHSSRSGGGSGWRVCLPWIPCPLINSKLTWYLTSQCHHSCGYAKSRQTDPDVKNHHSNQAKVV